MPLLPFAPCVASEIAWLNKVPTCCNAELLAFKVAWDEVMLFR